MALASTPLPAKALLRPGETCWRVERASRVAFLIDGEAFFAALAGALERARHQVLLLGWDFHGGVRLRRRSRRAGPKDELIGLLRERLAARPELRVHGLGWALGSLLAFSREPLPRLQLGLHDLDRLDFRLDSCHPWLACHHQKVVVVDDRVAFAGGFDVTAYRWDSREHLPDDPRRTTPEGDRYGPFHDVQLLVEGDAAAALGELARNRWLRATGQRLTAPPADGPSPWPPSAASVLQQVGVGIARTDPGYTGPAPREVEQLYLASIRAARHVVYAENQYFTSERLVEAFAARLQERDGPELLLVLPARCPAWLEQATMGRLRAAALARLRACDRYGRLGLYAPRVAPGVCVNVHAKVMTVDDELVRIGSSNLSTRSLELDTECDLAVEAGGRPDVREVVAKLRADLVAEHLGLASTRVRELAGARRSWIRAVEELRGGERTLVPIADAACPTPAALVLARLLDPRRGAVGPETARHRRRARRAVLALALGLALVSALAALGVVGR